VAAANNERDQVNDQYNAALAQLEVARVTISQLRDAAISQQRHKYHDAVRAYENAAADRDRVMDQRDAVMSKLSAANARIKNLEQQVQLLLLDLRSLSIPDSS
jgi:chromosome segregation ATPase